jgi:hypothetical protein
MIDERVRARPEMSYEYAELFADLIPDADGDQEPDPSSVG